MGAQPWRERTVRLRRGWHLDPEAEDFAVLLERFARNPLFRGIRIRPGRLWNFEHSRLRSNLAELAAARCTLDILIRGEEIVRMARLASELPGLRIMIDHLAHVPVAGNPPDPVWVGHMEHFAALVRATL